MTSTARQSMMQRLIAAAERDPRIVGLLDYGSSSEGRVGSGRRRDAVNHSAHKAKDRSRGR